MFTIEARFSESRVAHLGEARTLDDALEALDRIIGISGHTVTLAEKDRVRMDHVGEEVTVQSPRMGSSTTYVIGNAG
jgi:hypothetical protein